MAEALPRRVEGIVVRPLGTRLVLYHPGSREVSVLNATAAAVWAMCDGCTSLAEAAARIRERFRVPVERDVARDVTAVTRTLTERGLLHTSSMAPAGEVSR